tara:strand:+ start:109796 stop:110371 length:576 start_codon:yes stop_codon:yes gene_type:complete
MSPRSPEQFQIIREEKRALIFDAALHLFAEEGIYSSSISKIAKRAGISKGLIYNYFESKEDLLRQLMFDLMDRATELFGIAGKTELSKKDFIGIIDKSIEVVKEDVQHWKLYFAIISQPYVLEKFMGEMMERSKPMIDLYIDYFQKNFKENPIEQMRFFTATLDGIQMHILMDPDNFPSEFSRNMIVKLFT